MSQPSSETKVAKRGKKALAIPFDVTAFHDRLLELAGVTTEERVRLYKAALVKLESMLEAKETKFFSYMGTVNDEREVENLALQRKAALDLLEIMGGNTKAKDEGKGKGAGTVKVTIKKFVVNMADSSLPGAAPVVVDMIPEAELVDLPPEQLPDESVIPPSGIVSERIQDGQEADDRSSAVAPISPSPLLDDR